MENCKHFSTKTIKNEIHGKSVNNKFTIYEKNTLLKRSWTHFCAITLKSLQNPFSSITFIERLWRCNCLESSVVLSNCNPTSPWPRIQDPGSRSHRERISIYVRKWGVEGALNHPNLIVVLARTFLLIKMESAIDLKTLHQKEKQKEKQK